MEVHLIDALSDRKFDPTEVASCDSSRSIELKIRIDVCFAATASQRSFHFYDTDSIVGERGDPDCYGNVIFARKGMKGDGGGSEEGRVNLCILGSIEGFRWREGFLSFLVVVFGVELNLV